MSSYTGCNEDFPAGKETGHSPLVLIVEDNEMNQDMARDLLQRAGYRTLEAHDADTGIAMAKRHRPDLILMDMHLPIKNGYEATRAIKADPDIRDIPVIAFTALAMEEEQEKARQHGCSGVIAKPINVDQFAETVASFLTYPFKTSETSVRIPASPTPSTPTDTADATRSPGTRKVLVVDEQPQHFTLLSDILGQLQAHTIQAANGREALYLAREEYPDLILMNIRLPDMSGPEALEQLRADARLVHIPVIFIAAPDTSDAVAEGLRLGASDYITQPLMAEEVRARVQAVLRYKQLQDALRRHMIQTERATQDLEQFLLAASHDMQAPLRKIRQFLSFMHKAGLETTLADNRDCLDGIARNADEMEALLQDLLALSRVNRHIEPFTPVSLSETLERVIENNQARIQASKARIVVEPLPVVEASPQQMRILFQALIENALKFRNEAEPPVIRITSHPDGEGVRIEVRDNGPGFKQELSETAFQPFQKLHGKKYPGRGMGLAIARKIAERHGGTLTAISQPNAGSTFILTLPLRQSGTI